MSALRVVLSIRLSCALAGILAGAPLLASESVAPNDDARAKQFAAIDSFNSLDPQSPDTLNSRLAYANFHQARQRRLPRALDQIQFTYRRSVPCITDSSEVSCIEIVLRAAHDPTILKAWLGTLARGAHLPHGHVPRLWSVTTMRLVTDPATLWTYRLETRWHAYWSIGGTGPDQSLIQSEKTMVLMSAPQSQKKERT